MKQPKRINSVVKKTLLSVAVLIFMLVGGLFVNIAFTQDPVEVHAASDADAMQAEIEELRALIQLLLANMDNSSNQIPQAAQAGVPQISGQRAREIAVEFIGYGTTGEVTLFTDNGVLTFEVEVRQNNVRYMVYVNAATGGVIRMSSHENTAVIPPSAVVPNYPPHQPAQIQQPVTPAAPIPPTPVPQVIPAPAPQPAPSSWATPTPSWTSPTPGNWSSPSPGGWSWSTWMGW